MTAEIKSLHTYKKRWSSQASERAQRWLVPAHSGSSGRMSACPSSSVYQTHTEFTSHHLFLRERHVPTISSQQVSPSALFTRRKCSIIASSPYLPPNQTHSPQHTHPAETFSYSCHFKVLLEPNPQRHLDLVPDNLITFRVRGKEHIRLQV